MDRKSDYSNFSIYLELVIMSYFQFLLAISAYLTI